MPFGPFVNDVAETPSEAQVAHSGYNTPMLNSPVISRHPTRLSDTDSTLSGDVRPTDLEKLEEEPVKDPNLVEFDGPDDPGNPKNWSKKRRWCITIAGSFMTFVTTIASSIFATAIGRVSKEYHIGSVTATLGVSLFLMGYVFGPILFGPISEMYGRRVPLIIGYTVFAIFQIPVAVARNVETIMLGRFFGGFAAAAPIAVLGGLLADIWDPLDRSYAIIAYAVGGFSGPVVAPIIGGFITESYLGWRWTAWITLIMAALFGAIGFVVIPETSAPRILQLRAKDMRYRTKNWAYHAKADEVRIDLYTIFHVYMIRPFIMLVQEPILAFMTAYMSYIYGICYLFFEAFPVSFEQERGWSLGVGSLPFASFAVGIAMGAGGIAFSTATNFKRALIKHGKPVPEERLPPMIVGAVLLPIGLFWFAWTSNPHIIWVPQVMSCALLGGSTMMCFWQGIAYLIDVYGFYSNSALAINTLFRSLLGAGFPLFAHAMFVGMGVPWATSLLGFISAAFAPVPALLYIYGARIRARSKFVPR